MSSSSRSNGPTVIKEADVTQRTKAKVSTKVYSEMEMRDVCLGEVRHRNLLHMEFQGGVQQSLVNYCLGFHPDERNSKSFRQRKALVRRELGEKDFDERIKPYLGLYEDAVDEVMKHSLDEASKPHGTIPIDQGALDELRRNAESLIHSQRDSAYSSVFPTVGRINRRIPRSANAKGKDFIDPKADLVGDECHWLLSDDDDGEGISAFGSDVEWEAAPGDESHHSDEDS